MINKKIINFGIIFLIGILVISLVSASYSRVNPNYGAFDSFVRENPISDKERCEAGQDFILQIAPLGCTPAVVRSDLLEEQNVPVFCQVAATKINPLIDVEAIEGISFSGQYPKEVSGVGFHPAQAALGVSGDLNSPLLNNIGYAVIVLKKQESERDMPDFVSGNLTANLRYDIKNAFGIGRASFYLPEIENSEWENRKTQYSFWQGRGYLRAENIDNDKATISVYNDLKKISSVNLDKGETSGDIYLPGFDCLAGLRLRLDSLENPDKRVKLDINGEIVEVAEGEKFLENKCFVRNIDKKGIVEEVEIRCDTDDQKNKRIDLKVSPNVKLEIEGVKQTEFEVGDILYQDEVDSMRNIFLGYVGKGKDGKLFAMFAMTTAKSKEEYLNSIDMRIIKEIAEVEESYYKRGEKDLVTELKKDLAFMTIISNAITRGSDYSYAIYEGGDSVEGIFRFRNFYEIFLKIKEIIFKDTYTIKKIKFVGLAGPEDKLSKDGFSENYKNAKEDYDRVTSSFGGENCGEITCGEEALYKMIILAFDNNQKKTTVDLCEKFNKDYPESKKNLNEYCKDKLKLSSSESSTQDVVINNRVKRISFEEIYEPSFEDYGAVISVSGTKDRVYDFPYNLEKGEQVKLSDNEFFELKEVNDDYVLIHAEVKPEGIVDKLIIQQKDYKIKLNSYEVIGDDRYQIRLEKINLKKSAKVSVIPNVNNVGTTASFPFKVGIEKRSIQLSPEKTKERIGNLDETIKEWEDKSNKLGNVVKGLKGACLATGATLTIKNFIENGLFSSGKSIARQNVMRGEGGWNSRCADAVGGSGELASKGYKTINECLTKESSNIDEEVDKYYGVMSEQNEDIKELQKECEQDSGIIDSLLGGKSIDTDCFKDKLISDSYKKELVANCGGNIKVSSDKEVPCSEIINMIDKDSIGVEQLRRLQLNSRVDSDMAKSQFEKDLKDIYVNNEKRVEVEDIANQLGQKPEDVALFLRKDAKELKYTGQTYGNIKSKIGIIVDYTRERSDSVIYLDDNTPIQTIWTSDGKKYVAVLDKNGDKYAIRKNGLYDFNGIAVEDEELTKAIYFKEYDSSTYENKFKSVSGETGVVVKFYETDPYKGLPALVPFDLKNGWYVATQQTLPVLGNIKPYDESGRVTSLWLCNVGDNGVAEFKSGIGDDICRQVNLGTGQPYDVFSGLDTNDASKFVRCAVDAIEDASRHKSGGKVSISTTCDGSHSINIGKPAVDIPEMQCQDFMSPKECNILFNVCDPVICPSSRCNLGGTYHVQDVVQSGIIGSIALCLPNIREGIYVPVCLTGIQAGIDGYLSIAKAHRDCLQESLDTGKTVGICDEIYSIHLCEFFWRQGLPVAKLILPKLIELAMGQGIRGGGEYLGVAEAWANADKSVTYFTQYYAANSYKAFKARTAEDVGGEVCKSFVSGVYPEGGNLLDSLTEPDSPSQFHGRFDEIPFTTATVPPVSQYKVFYHIYAGKDSGVYYQVYLKSGSESSFYQDTSYRKIVDSGYVTRGQYVDETKDFTAPAGYKEMCIRVNDQEECGFKQVSTSYAVNYIKDKYMEDQASQKNIKTGKECISGTASVYSLISPNLQEGVDEAINPAIYERGIIRICATDNPGKGTDAKAGMNGSRWIPIGYCDDQKIICWQDQNSIKNVINDLNIESKVLSEQTNNYLEILEKEGNYEKKKVIDKLIEDINDGKLGPKEIIKKISDIIGRVFWNNQKARLFLERGNAYGVLAGEDRKAREQERSSGGGGVGGSFDEGEISKLNECSDCDKWEDGVTCTEELCNQIGENLDKNCQYEDSWISFTEGSCKEVFSYGKNAEDECKIFCGGLQYKIEDSCLENLGDLSFLKQKVNPLAALKTCCCYAEIKSIFLKKTDGISTKNLQQINERYSPCGGYSFLITYAAKKYNIPDPLFLMSLMIHESSHNGIYCDVNDDTDESYGLMQLTKGTVEFYCAGKINGISNFDDIKGSGNTNNNINCGAKILRDKYEEFKDGKQFSGACTEEYKKIVYEEWAAALRGYNGWGCNVNYPQQDKFVDNVLEIYDSFEI
ncbi:MAG: transglycosylase SLT domain-containing protein [archaeon]